MSDVKFAAFGAALFAACAIAGEVRANPAELANIVQLEAGDQFACALDTAGSVKCWGNNAAGQLGDGTTISRPYARAVSGLSTGVLRIAVSRGATDPEKALHACAILASGAVKCWGSNSSKQLGRADIFGSSTIPVDVIGLQEPAIAIAAGQGHTCALLASGAVSCWGMNFAGQLGRGSTSFTEAPGEVYGLSGGVLEITASGQQACALPSTAGVLCWGAHGYPIPPVSFNTYITPAPTPVSSLSGVVSISAGGGENSFGFLPLSSFACAVTSSSGVRCWGSNVDGQLGDGSQQSRLQAADVAGLAGIVQVSAGGSNHGHACATTALGGAKCWGWIDCVTLGYAPGCNVSAAFWALPVDVAGLTGVQSVSVGGDFSCAIVSGGQVRCWGTGYGQQPTAVFSDGAPQTITIVPIPGIAVGRTAPLSATGGGSGNPITFESLSPETCSVTGSSIIALAKGTCEVAANQAGNLDYAAAPEVILPIPVSDPLSQSIQYSTPTAYVGTLTAIQAFATSLLPVSFASTTPGTCSVTQSIVSGVAEGPCSIVASQPGNYLYDPAPDVTLTFAVLPLSASYRLVNVSTRLRVGAGDGAAIAGFVIEGVAKTVIVRAIGPGLIPYGVQGALANPRLELVRSSDQVVIAANDNWHDDANAGQVEANGLAPVNPLEAALYITLPPGAYTAVVRGVDDGTPCQNRNCDTGVALIEVYELDVSGGTLINVSTRGFVGTGSEVMIGGFVIAGDHATVVVRAIGPSLVNYGVTGVLANPQVQIWRIEDSFLVASNDDWGSDSNAAQLQSSGLAPLSPLESAIYITLPRGAYTAIVRGANDGTGIGLVEVYKVGL